MRIAYLDCVGGISGDMTLGALVGAGWPAESLLDVPRRLHLEDVRVTISPVRRGVFAATKVDVHVDRPATKHRHLHHIETLLAAAELPAPARDLALRVFRRLAAAEAETHGTTLEKVHFHEVGAEDALVDIAGAALGVHELGIERVWSSSLPLGGGFVESQHGRIPIPAPATALLLRGAPVRPSPVQCEQVTPTGAALVQELVSDWNEPFPEQRLDRVGVGAGGRDDRESPNILRLFVGEAATGGLAMHEEVDVLETSLDDENPQHLAALGVRVLAAGALDWMVVPAAMKKGRLGSWVIVLSRPTDSARIAELLLEHSGTLGVRTRRERRTVLPRELALVTTEFGQIELKVATLINGEFRAVPEFESVLAASERSGVSLRRVTEAAIAAWRSETVRKSPSPSKKTD